MKKTMLAALLMMVAMTISAQPKEKEHVMNVFQPHWYIQAQGGAQYTLGEIDFSDLISPNVQLSVGYQFDKVIGARISANAWQSKAGSEIFGAVHEWKWDYIAPAIDFTFNLSNLFAGYNPNRLVNVSAFIGAGANIAWKNDEAFEAAGEMAMVGPSFGTAIYGTELEYLWADTKTRFVGRGGLNVDFRISDAVSLGIEANANCLSDKYNSKRAGNADWYFNALAGLKINLGKTHTTKPCPHHCAEPKVVEKIIEKIVEKPVPVAAPAPAPAPAKVEPIRREVFFTINSTKVGANEAGKIKEIAEYLNKNPKANVTVTGVADKGTGTSKINEVLAQKRAEAVAEALKKEYNIAADRIKVESNGDRVQPFAQNDKNRVTICVAE